MAKQRILTLVLAIAVILGGLSGCGGTNTTGGKLEPGKDGKITKDPLTLTAHIHMGAEWVFTNEDEKPLFKEAAKYTNVSLKGTSSPANADANQEFNIMLASSSLPDIIHGKNAPLNKAGRDGALIPLNELIEKHAPNITRMFKERPYLKKSAVATDGNIYFIPHARDGIPAEGFYIRKDWLDKLGLSLPKTVDEYYQVLKAFREKDPNGNGKQDEVPYFDRASSIVRLLQLWGVNGKAGNWYADENNKVNFGMYEPQYKDAMINLSKWYSEGLIDKEIYSRRNARDIMLGDNVGGSTHDWFSSTGAYNSTLANKIPGFEFVAFAPPADVNGKVKELMSREPVSGYGWGISKDNPYPVETIKYFDFWYSEMGERIVTYGVEGVDYNMVDGKPVLTDTYLKAPETAIIYMRNRGRGEIGVVMPAEVDLLTMNQYARSGYDMYVPYSVDAFPQMTFTSEEQRVVLEKEQAIKAYISEKQQKWLFGVEDVATGFDKYIADLDSMGMKELIAVYQAAYERYLKN